MPDLQLAVGPLKHALTEEQDKGGCLLDPLQHALLGEVGGPVVCKGAKQTGRKRQSGMGSCSLWIASAFSRPLTIPRLEAHPLELKVDGVGLVAPCRLAMATCTKGS